MTDRMLEQIEETLRLAREFAQRNPEETRRRFRASVLSMRTPDVDEEPVSRVNGVNGCAESSPPGTLERCDACPYRLFAEELREEAT